MRNYDRYDDRGYNRGYNDRGYNDRGYGRGYNDRGGYRDRGYSEPRDFKYQVGTEVVHKFTNERLFIINIGREQYECRTSDYGTKWFYEHELMPVEEVNK